MVENEKNVSCSKLAKIASKLVRNCFRIFCPPPEKKHLVTNQQNQSCSKLAKMARKLVGNHLRIFLPSPPQLGTKQIGQKWHQKT